MKTVKVRIAVAVDVDGDWHLGFAENEARELLSGAARVYWLTAELPVPEAKQSSPSSDSQGE